MTIATEPYAVQSTVLLSTICWAIACSTKADPLKPVADELPAASFYAIPVTENPADMVLLIRRQPEFPGDRSISAKGLKRHVRKSCIAIEIAIDQLTSAKDADQYRIEGLYYAVGHLHRAKLVLDSWMFDEHKAVLTAAIKKESPIVKRLLELQPTLARFKKLNPSERDQAAAAIEALFTNNQLELTHVVAVQIFCRTALDAGDDARAKLLFAKLKPKFVVSLDRSVTRAIAKLSREMEKGSHGLSRG